MSVAFDHLMVLVADEVAAAREFSEAGFAVTPRSELPGMANRLICFPSDAPYAASFIELLSVEQPDTVPSAIRKLVGQTLGPMAIVFAVPDMDACQRMLAQSGVAVAGPLEIKRRWMLPSGQTLDVALDVVIGDERALPFKWVIVKHHTVGHYQRAEFTAHANGCRGIKAVVVSVEDPMRAAETMECILRCGYRHVGACAVIDLQNVSLVLIPDTAGLRRKSHGWSAIAGVALLGGSVESDIDDLAHKLSERTHDGSGASIELSGLRLFPHAKDR